MLRIILLNMHTSLWAFLFTNDFSQLKLSITRLINSLLKLSGWTSLSGNTKLNIRPFYIYKKLPSAKAYLEPSQTSTNISSRGLEPKSCYKVGWFNFMLLLFMTWTWLYLEPIQDRGGAKSPLPLPVFPL